MADGIIALCSLSSPIIIRYLLSFGNTDSAIQSVIPSPTPHAGYRELNVTPVLTGVIALLVVAISIVVALLIAIWCIRRKQEYTMPTSGSMDLEIESTVGENILQPVRFPPSPSRSLSSVSIQVDTAHSATVDVSGKGSRLGKRSPFRSTTRSTSLSSLVKLEHQPDFLQPNPTYPSWCSLEDIPTSVVTSTPTATPITTERDIEQSVFHYERTFSLSADELLQSYASARDECIPVISVEETPIDNLVTPENFRDIRELGVGQFGQVMLAETVGLSLKDLNLSSCNVDTSSPILVAVKKLKPDADREVQEAFEKETRIMSHLNHENIVRLLGVCSIGDAFIVMEYMENGDLNQYLRKHRLVPPHASVRMNQITVPTLLYMAVQIAKGMKYLASLRFIHRDLATRNCLVGPRNTVKIADFGMSRNLYSSFYYKIKGRAVLPVRWMATECFYGKFSEKSDVWAFGVTMWEIFMLAKRQPYDTMSNQAVIDDALTGMKRELLIKPKHCPPQVYKVMQRCWVHRPEERASFNEVYTSLSKFHAKKM